jgi:flagellar hook-associated protein 3 FlgL
MRIADNMMSSSLATHLSQVSNRLARLQSEVSSGISLQKPSDDPDGALRAAILRSGLSQNAQYQKTVKHAEAWLKSEDTALDTVQRLVREARSIGLESSNPRSVKERETYARQIDQLVDGIKQAANSSDGVHYLFAGFQTLTTPFSGTPGAIAYTGDAGAKTVEISEGMSLTINHSGAQVFNMGGADDATLPDLFETLSTMSAQALAGDTTGLQSSLAELDQHGTRLISLRAETGTRLQQVELGTERLTQTDLVLNDLLGAVESVDITEALVHLKEQENVYQAASYVASALTRGGLLSWMR